VATRRVSWVAVSWSPRRPCTCDTDGLLGCGGGDRRRGDIGHRCALLSFARSGEVEDFWGAGPFTFVSCEEGASLGVLAADNVRDAWGSPGRAWRVGLASVLFLRDRLRANEGCVDDCRVRRMGEGSLDPSGLGTSELLADVCLDESGREVEDATDGG
jgi:hypothetical protein